MTPSVNNYIKGFASKKGICFCCCCSFFLPRNKKTCTNLARFWDALRILCAKRGSMSAFLSKDVIPKDLTKILKCTILVSHPRHSTKWRSCESLEISYVKCTAAKSFLSTWRAEEHLLKLLKKMPLNYNFLKVWIDIFAPLNF